MKISLIHRSLVLALLGVVMGSLGPRQAAGQSFYEVGEVVDQDFSLYARRPFTNDVGEVVATGDPVRLSDFAGKILFLEFFYVW